VTNIEWWFARMFLPVVVALRLQELDHAIVAMWLIWFEGEKRLTAFTAF
jgi:hypothetical protein